MASRGKKILIGVGIGCGSLVLLVVVMFAIFTAWVSRPGELLEPQTLLGGDTAGFAEWTLSLDDPGTKEFVDGIMEAGSQSGRPGQTPLPPQLEAVLLGWQDKRNRESFEQLFPLSVGWTLTPGEAPEQDLHLFGVSLKSAGNRLVFADWVLGLTLGFTDQRDAEKIPYREENLYRFGIPTRDPLILFVRGNDVFFTYDLGTAQVAVDRLFEPASQPKGSTALEGLFTRTPEERPLRGALTNQRMEIFRTWEKLAVEVEDPEALEEMTRPLLGVAVSGNLEADGRLSGLLELRCPDADWAAEHRDAALRAFEHGLQYEKLTLEAKASSEDEWIRIEFHLEGFLKLLDRLEDLADERIEVER